MLKWKKTRNIIFSKLKNLCLLFGIDIRTNIDRLEHINNFSQFNEQDLIRKYLTALNKYDKYVVDIGAHNGIHFSNTANLFKNGNIGLAVEFGSDKFSDLAYNYKYLDNVNLAKAKVNPKNISKLMAGYNVPKEFGLLSLDIDGYDYFILEEILSHFRPSLVCVEINEKIPPPIEFTVKYDPDYFWKGDHFQGFSISKLDVLCNNFNYGIVKLAHHNAFIIPNEINIFKRLTPDEAYKEGYIDNKLRKIIPSTRDNGPCRGNLDNLLTLQPKHAVDYLKSFFSVYEGRYTINIGSFD